MGYLYTVYHLIERVWIGMVYFSFFSLLIRFNFSTWMEMDGRININK